MGNGIFTAVSGIAANQAKLDVISNNIANVNTIAFKSSGVNFQTLFAQTISNGTPPSGGVGGTNPRQVGVGVMVADVPVNFSQGGTQFTGRANDYMISGNGFFTLQIGSGTTKSDILTRAGNFSLDASGNLVSSTGNKVLGTRTVDGDNATYIQPINVPQNLKIWKEVNPTTNDVVKTWVGTTSSAAPVSASLSSPSNTLTVATPKLSNWAVGKDGAITATYSNGDIITVQTDSAGVFREIRHLAAEGQSYAQSGYNSHGTTTILDNAIKPEQIQLRMCTVPNPEGLLYAGSNNYNISVSSGQASYGTGGAGNRGTIDSGSLESSNVDIAQQFTNMIVSQRGLEANSKVISVQSEVLRTIIGII